MIQLKPDNSLVMWYWGAKLIPGAGGADETAIGIARSWDGSTWARYDKPIFLSAAQGEWDHLIVGRPYALNKGNEHWLFYGGVAGPSAIGTQVGLAYQQGDLPQPQRQR
jgi:hypothetical protein